MSQRCARSLAAIAVGLSIGACTSITTPFPSPTFPVVRVSNQTSIAVTLVVNGSAVAVIPPGEVADPVPSPLPVRPWVIQLKSPSGNLLQSVSVPSGDIAVGMFPDPPNLACGLLYLVVAGQLPAGGPAFTPLASAQPCD
jgi:hypothetical protein